MLCLLSYHRTSVLSAGEPEGLSVWINLRLELVQSLERSSPYVLFSIFFNLCNQQLILLKDFSVLLTHHDHIFRRPRERRCHSTQHHHHQCRSSRLRWPLLIVIRERNNQVQIHKNSQVWKRRLQKVFVDPTEEESRKYDANTRHSNVIARNLYRKLNLEFNFPSH